MIVISDPAEFEWDKANAEKNWIKHGIKLQEAEEAFFDQEKRISKDIFHSKAEERFILLGKTKKRKILFVVFTMRKNKIRVISARSINKKERRLYEKKA